VLIVLVVSGLFDDFAVLFVLVVSGLFDDFGDFFASRSASAAVGATAAAFRFLVAADDVRSAASGSPPATVEEHRVAVEGHRVASDGARPAQPASDGARPSQADASGRMNTGGAPPAAAGPLQSGAVACTAASPSACAPSSAAPGCLIAPSASVDPKTCQPGICCPAPPGWKIHPAIIGITGIPGLADICHPP
jgi:hypothetical protein